MIESGSRTPGVDAREFGLPPSTALRIELPAPSLRPFLTHYHLLDSDRKVHDGVVSWALPAWPMIRVILTDEPMSLRIGPRLYDPLPREALYGFTSRARTMTTHGGLTVGIGLSPLGWARLVRQSADTMRDRIVPLDTAMAPADVAALRYVLEASDRGAGAAKALDSFFAPLLAEPIRAEPAIEALMRLIEEDEIHDIAAAAERIGIGQTALRRLAVRYFGSPPKTLLVQERFMRSLVRMLLAGEKPDYTEISASYFDRSHFLRDADRFLGLTPRRFMQMDHRFMLAFMRARQQVIRADRAAAVAPPASGNPSFTMAV